MRRARDLSCMDVRRVDMGAAGRHFATRHIGQDQTVGRAPVGAELILLSLIERTPIASLADGPPHAG